MTTTGAGGHEDATAVTDGAGGSDSTADEISGDVVAVGPTGDTRGSVETEPGPARVDPVDDEDTGVGHSGDPVAVEPPDAPQSAT